MGNVNRKAERSEIAHAREVIEDAFPGCEAVFGGSAGHRSPRVRTISFRVRDGNGKYRSNTVWIMPEHLAALTVPEVRRLVADANGQ